MDGSAQARNNREKSGILAQLSARELHRNLSSRPNPGGIMETAINDFVRQQLETRRDRLRDTIAERTGHPAHLHALLREVDSALDRIANGCYGIGSSSLLVQADLSR